MITVRLKFKKTGLSSYYSQLDLQRVMSRALRKSRLPVWYSLGFNPHIYMTFTLPLSLGHESMCETVDFRLTEECDEQQIISALQNTLPDGIEIISAGEPTFDAKEISFAEYKITLFDKKDKILNAINEYSKLETAIVSKKSKRLVKDINLKELVKSIEIVKTENNSVTFTAFYPAGIPLNVNPGLLLELFKNNYDIKILDAHILREQIFNKNMEILQ